MIAATYTDTVDPRGAKGRRQTIAARGRDSHRGGSEMDEPQNDSFGFEDLARRLNSAYQSWRLHNKSVDHYFKTYVEGREISKYWVALAQQIDEDMRAAREERRRKDKS